MVFSGTVGDWKLHWEEFNLQHHYNAEEVCQNCRAVKAAESELCMHNFTVDAPWTLTDRTLTEYIDEQERLDTVSPFCSIRGWHTKNIFEDVVHTDLLGVRLNANGGALWELAWMGHWGAVPQGGLKKGDELGPPQRVGRLFQMAAQ